MTTARWRWAVLPVLLVAATALGTELAVLPAGTWEARLVGSNALVCLTAIPLFALAPLAALLLTMRRAAPASPTLAGAACGALAAAAAAVIYAFHCFDDSPLFVLTWYSLGSDPGHSAGRCRRAPPAALVADVSPAPRRVSKNRRAGFGKTP